MSIVKLARPEIQALRPYQAADQIDDTIRLNANEAPHSNVDSQFRRPLNRYPEVRPTGLRELLAKRYGCGSDNLIVTRGTSEGIDLLIRVFCRAGQDSVVTPTPTFSMYAHYAEVQGARLIECPTSREQDFRVDIDAVLAACDESTRLIIVCSPNNPTGNLIPQVDLIRLLETRGNDSAVVVDEAYIEFAGKASIIELLDRYENLIVLRTLSKALAYAGVRCGCVIAAPPIIEMLEAGQAPYALATPVVECVETALKSEALQEADRSVQEIVSERSRMLAAIGEYSFVQRAWASAANFFLIEVEDVDALLQRCSEAGISGTADKVGRGRRREHRGLENQQPPPLHRHRHRE